MLRLTASQYEKRGEERERILGRGWGYLCSVALCLRWNSWGHREIFPRADRRFFEQRTGIAVALSVAFVRKI
jgi:hypothetical protein